MSEINILVEGYAKKRDNGWVVSSTAVLIKDNDLNILVDPGTNRKMLLKALTMESLKPNDIDMIFLTHYHLDHVLNIRLFPEADIYDGDTVNIGDKIIDYSGNIPGTEVEVVETPGHAYEHASLLVNTSQGKIVVAGDLFWWNDGEEPKMDKEYLMDLDDPYVKSQQDLKRSRRKILDLADYIIPGHGRMFKINK